MIEFADKVAVRYDEFKSTFIAALRDSGLLTIGPRPSEEVLDLRTPERTVTVYVEPAGRDMAAPFHDSGKISWRWDALQTARTATTDEDLLTELFGREGARGQETVQPRLQDIELRASLQYGKWTAIPSRAVWSDWRREAIGRLQTTERLVDDDVMHDPSDEGFAVLAWLGEPEMETTCDAAGDLLLKSLSVSAFQMIGLPRTFDDPERRPDDDPYEQLSAVFLRVKAALYAWSEVTDQLT
jgi:hypothetical protein